MDNITAKLKGLHKNWVFWLILITALAIIIRSIPGWIYEAWGCDFGIYFGITKSMVQTRELFPPYAGWGNAYNEFPISYLINALAHWTTGIDVSTIMLKLTPIFGGLSIFVFYFLVYELTKNRKISLLSALFLAVLPFHVYQTSHASPLTIGHFFMVLSMYLFVKYRKNNKYAVPLAISTILLVMSHHLTTYFYLIVLVFIVFIENVTVKEWTNTFKKDVLYLFLTSILIFSYWALIAKTVYENFMISGFYLGDIRVESIHIVLLFYVLFFAMFGSIKLLRKYRSSLHIKINWSSLQSFIMVLIICYSLMMPLLFFDAPWINSKITPEVIILTTPFIIALAFGFANVRYIYHIKNGKFIFGWFLAILISLLYSVVTQNKIILAHRHFEYLMVPLAIFIVYGIGGIFSDSDFKELLSGIWDRKSIQIKNLSNKVRISRKNRLINLIVIFLLVISLASTTYSSYRSLNAGNEEITKEDMQAIEWMSENLDKNTSMIATDHRLARMAEAYGFNTTQDQTVNLWDAVNLDEYIDELIGIGKIQARVTHIVIDDIMKNEVVHVYEGIDRRMINETLGDARYAAYDKFKQEPFELIYRNATIEIDSVTKEPVHWTEVYAVNWTYIEKVI